MPNKEQILESLQSVSNDYSMVATIWHVALVAFFALLIFKFTPSNRLTGVLISFLLFSVALFAWIGGNPFNGTVFALLGILVVIFALRASLDPVQVSGLPFLIPGILMILFGLVYPHFLHTGSLLRYLYASPAGLIPCPTLSIAIGILLVFSGLGSPAMTLCLVVAGLFYGSFGAFRLGVQLDLFLLIGTLFLLVRYVFMVRPQS